MNPVKDITNDRLDHRSVTLKRAEAIARANPTMRFSSSEEPGVAFSLADFVRDNAEDGDVEDYARALAMIATVGDHHEIDSGAGGVTWITRLADGTPFMCMSCCDEGVPLDDAALCPKCAATAVSCEVCGVTSAPCLGWVGPPSNPRVLCPGCQGNADEVDAFDRYSDEACEILSEYLDRAMSRPRPADLGSEIVRAADRLVDAASGAPILSSLMPDFPRLNDVLKDQSTPTIDAAATAARLHDRAIAMGLTWDGVGHIVVEWVNDEPRVAMARAARKAKR